MRSIPNDTALKNKSHTHMALAVHIAAECP